MKNACTSVRAWAHALFALSLILLPGHHAGAEYPDATQPTVAASAGQDDPLNEHRPPGYGVYDDVYDFYMNVPRHDWQLFKADELFLDLGYLVTNSGDGRLDHGATAGFGYYCTRHFGVAADILVYDGPVSDVFLSASGLVRLPIDYSSIAFYGMFGFGHQFSSVERFNVHVGGGVDVRLTDSVSSFIDFRYSEPKGFRGTSTFRVGLRFLF